MWPIVISNLFDSACIYQDLLGEVREAIHSSTVIYVLLLSTPNVVGHANDTIFGYKPPFDVPTCSLSYLFTCLSQLVMVRYPSISGATLVILSSQLTFIFNFFLSRNLRLACEHAWDQTIASRGKGPTFWQPYVEEWDFPPKINIDQWAGLENIKNKLLRFAVKHCGLALDI